MIYSVEISGQAEKELKGIYEYISFVLFSPVNAAKQLQQIITAISKLDYMPERYRKYEKNHGAAVVLGRCQSTIILSFTP